MKTDSLHALIIDQYNGELTPEVAELLTAHLERDPQARAEAERIRAALEATCQALQRHPELVRHVNREARPWRPKILNATWLARAAAVVLFASLMAAGGFWLGRTQSSLAELPTVPTSTSAIASTSSPWARYHMRFDPAGSGIQVVRVDTTSAPSQP